MIKKSIFYFDVSNSKEFYDNSGFTEVAYDSLTIWCKTDNQPLNLQLKPIKIHLTLSATGPQKEENWG